MRLEGLYSNFGEMSPEDQLAYIASYRLRRAEDMEKPPTYVRKKATKSTAKRSKIDFSDEEKFLMKSLGLKAKDLILLRESTAVPEEVEEDDAAIFDDGSYSEGDDE